MKSTSKTPVTVAVISALIVIGVLTYFLANKWHRNQVALSRQEAQNACNQVVQKMEAELDQLRAELEKLRQMQPDDEVFPTVFGTPAPDREADARPADCATVNTQMNAFFKYLDGQPYLADRELDGGSAGFFRECAALLMANPPENIAEMKDLFRLVKNVTHFYRVLGKNRLMLAKDILATEDKALEAAMDVFYTRIVACKEPLPGDDQPLSIERLYDYAGYFLNTLGGRSYVLRRESKLRMLVNYYAILIIDKANDEKFNQYGIDLRAYIDYLFYDISNQKGLIFRERYLTRLTGLRDKYM